MAKIRTAYHTYECPVCGNRWSSYDEWEFCVCCGDYDILMVCDTLIEEETEDE